MNADVELLLRLLGVAVTGLTLLVVIGAAAVIAWALVRRRQRVARWAALSAVGAVGVQGLLVLAGPVVTPERALPPGAEIALCGLDCHLLLAAPSAARDGALAVRLHLRSNATTVAEYPAHVRLRLVDAGGRRYAPIDGAPTRPLGPGESYVAVVKFPLPPAGALRLEASWGDWPDYLIPGPEHPLVKRRTALAIAPETS